jgi:multidrug efflux pump subunit AcrB
MGENIVFLKDIAEVSRTYEDKTYEARFKGKRAVYITATQKPGTNIFDVIDGLKVKLAEFQSELPNTIETEMVFDQSESVSSRLDDFFSNLLQGLLLVGFIVIVAVGVRASSIVLIAIPISILMGIGFLDLSGYGLQQMSIAGLVIALGLLVDNAIVVTENIARFMRLGYSPKEAAVKGTTQIGWAIVSSTVTTVLAFVPMMMMQNITGEFIRSMPLTVVYTLAASLLVSLTITPYLSSKWIALKEGNGRSRFQKMLTMFIETKYRRSLNFALSHTKIIITSAAVVFIGALSLFPLVGISFFPKAEKPQFLININTPDGTSQDKTDEITRRVESILDTKKGIKHYATSVGHGNPRIYYNIIMKRETSNYAQLLIQLDEYELEAFDNLLSDLRDEFDNYPGARIEVKEFEQGPPIEAPIAIKIIGDNLEILKSISRDVEDMFLATEGTVNVLNPLSTTKTDLFVNINRAKAGLYGVPLVEIDRTVRAAIAGLAISQYRDNEGKEYNIVVRSDIADKPKLNDLDKIFVASVTGAQVQLKQLATIEFKATPMSISHYDLARTVMLTSDVKRNISVQEVTQEIISRLDSYKFPKGYGYYVAGEREQRDESFGGMMKAIIIAMVGIFGVLVLQFRSYSQPLIVFSAIPLAIIGSIIALLVTGNSFSFTAFVGITSLIGIVINNSIILVDYTNQLRAEGMILLEALKKAGEVRFIPIILTTATTVGGLLPLTLRGGTLWAPMGWTIIGGLIASTVLTLIIVPVLYKIYTK